MVTSKRRQKNSKPKMLVFFLFLAVIFWMLTKFSKEYTATVSSFVSYDNIPESNALGLENAENIDFDLSANGFEFLLFKLKTPTIQIDVSKYYNRDNGLAAVTNADLIKEVTKQLNKDRAVTNVYPKELSIALDAIVSKKIPVKVSMDITYKDGFKPLGNAISQPDSITISGPSDAVNAVEFVTAKTDALRDIADDFSEKVLVDFPKKSGITIAPESVSIALEVREFTQKTITVSIEATHLPAEGTVRLIPETITLTFGVSVNDFNAIAEGDFRIVCDYNERNLQENYMVPKLVKSPKGILNLEMSTKKVEYLIFKQ